MKVAFLDRDLAWVEDAGVMESMSDHAPIVSSCAMTCGA